MGRGRGAGATDAFAALQRARGQLEAGGLIPVCYGASRRAILTGMAREAGGRKVYHAQLSRPLHRDQLVYLMDGGPDVEPATVAEQEEFRRQYWASVVRAGRAEPPAPADPARDIGSGTS